jgi:hypothetical protein
MHALTPDAVLAMAIKPSGMQEQIRACTHKRGIGRMPALGANRTRRDGGNDVNDPNRTYTLRTALG